MQKPKRGRPPILDETKRAQIYGVLSVGGSMALAANAVGCCVRTIYNTMERDPKFKAEVQRARAGCEIRLLKCIDDAAMEPRYWRAAAWKLERLRPERYRAPQAGSITPEHMSKVIDAFLSSLSEELPNDRDMFDRIADRAANKFRDLAIESDDRLEFLVDYLHLPTKDPPADAA